jgi:hypothetical protein
MDSRAASRRHLLPHTRRAFTSRSQFRSTLVRLSLRSPYGLLSAGDASRHWVVELIRAADLPTIMSAVTTHTIRARSRSLRSEVGRASAAMLSGHRIPK